MQAINEIYAAAGLGAADLDLQVPSLPVGGANLLPVGGANLLAVGGAILLPVGGAILLPVGGANLLPVGGANLPVGGAHLLGGHNLPLGNLPNPDDGQGFTKILKKDKKLNFKGVSHKTYPCPLSPEPITLDPVSHDIEVVWCPKTSSRRATMKWSMARQGSVVGTSQANGFFVHGSFGETGIEY